MIGPHTVFDDMMAFYGSTYREDYTDMVSSRVDLEAYPLPIRLQTTLTESIRKGRMGYTAPLGPSSLRSLIAKYENAVAGHEMYAPENVGVFPGSITEGMRYTLAEIMGGAGGEVLFPTPNHWLIPELAATDFPQMSTRALPCGPEQRFLLTPGQVDSAVSSRAKALYLCYPLNPSGATFTYGALEEIVGEAAQHDLWVLCDEANADLTFPERTHPNVARTRYEKVVRFKSLSKTLGLPSLNVGYVLAPSQLLAGRERGIRHGHPGEFACKVYEEHVAMSLGDTPEAKEYAAAIERNVRGFAMNHELARERLLDSPRVEEVIVADGGFNLFFRADYAGGVNLSRNLFSRTGVTTLPGTVFCMEKDDPWIRINVCQHPYSVEDAVDRLACALDGV